MSQKNPNEQPDDLTALAEGNEPEQKRSVWWNLFMLSFGILGIGMILGMIVRVWKGREFTNEEAGFLLWPVTIIYLSAGLYAFCYMVQTECSWRLRYFFVYPVVIFLVVLVSLGAVALWLEVD